MPDIANTSTNYGLDMDCATDVNPTFASVSGRTNLAQNIARCTITPRGRLLSDPNWGYGVQQFLGRGVTSADLRRMERGLRAAYLRDERLIDASVVLVYSVTTQILTIYASLVDGAGPFSLVLSVSGVTASILGIG